MHYNNGNQNLHQKNKKLTSEKSDTSLKNPRKNRKYFRLYEAS